MNAYVVSPSASGENSAGRYIQFIKKHHIALMGWSLDDPNDKKGIGRLFYDIPLGSLIIIAYGKNTSKKLIGAGFVDGESKEIEEDNISCAQGRHLTFFCDLSELPSPFSIDCKYGDTSGNWIPSCYQLSDNEADQHVVDTVLKEINIHRQETQMKELCQLLERCHNLILTGAPGTGKTFLARQIAEMMVLNHIHDKSNPLSREEESKLKAQTDFCQFHPSYDYTDFVEGLRPTKPGSDGNIGFVRQDGIFKVFCKRAIESTINARKDNFEDAWQKLVDWLEENEFAEVENLNGKTTFEVELNENGNGLATRIYATEEERQKHVITPGRSRYYNKEQLYRVYRGLAGVPNGGHDNYRKAVLKMMMSKFGLSEYNPGSEENTPSKPKYVIIIDEINRGDIAKIFGELFFAIDPGYRGIAGRVKTQYSNLVGDDDVFKDGFYVPDNVYIIGTMNDIDRNVESMDFAIRRRFTWREVSPEETVCILSDKDHGIPEYEDIAVKHMETINALIVNTPGLGSAYQIGASYFLKLRDYKGDFSKLWDYHIAPLLREYLRGLPNAENDFAKLQAAWDSVNQPQDTAQ